MQDNKNRRSYNFRFAISGLLIICGGILFYYILFHFDEMRDRLKYLSSVFTPLFTGIVIAYILNPAMRFIENKICFPLWNRIKKQKDHEYSKEKLVIRCISVFLIMVLFILMIYAVIMSIIPQIINNIKEITITNPSLQKMMSGFGDKPLSIQPQVEKIMNDMSDLLYNGMDDFIDKIKSYLVHFKDATYAIWDYASPVFKSLLNFLLGIIFSVYLLFDKEKYIAQAKKLIYAFFKRERANNFINNLRYSDKIFGGFITGKIIDSIIIGIMCYIGVLLIGTKAAVLIAVVVGVTNVIPYFGPFIGAIPCGLLILMEDPKKCLIFIIFIFILQQFDGNILGPKILGSSIGLNGFWVVFAITVFSKLLGVIGLFMGVPIFAVIYAAIRTLVNQRLDIKHMPVSTDYYEKSDYITDTDGVSNTGKSFRFAKKTFDKVSRETYQEDLDRENTLTNSSIEGKISGEIHVSSENIAENVSESDKKE